MSDKDIFELSSNATHIEYLSLGIDGKYSVGIIAKDSILSARGLGDGESSVLIEIEAGKPGLISSESYRMFSSRLFSSKSCTVRISPPPVDVIQDEIDDCRIIGGRTMTGG